MYVCLNLCMYMYVKWMWPCGMHVSGCICVCVHVIWRCGHVACMYVGARVCSWGICVCPCVMYVCMCVGCVHMATGYTCVQCMGMCGVHVAMCLVNMCAGHMYVE